MRVNNSDCILYYVDIWDRYARVDSTVTYPVVRRSAAVRRRSGRSGGRAGTAWGVRGGGGWDEGVCGEGGVGMGMEGWGVEVVWGRG